MRDAQKYTHSGWQHFLNKISTKTMDILNIHEHAFLHWLTAFAVLHVVLILQIMYNFAYNIQSQSCKFLLDVHVYCIRFLDDIYHISYQVGYVWLNWERRCKLAKSLPIDIIEILPKGHNWGILHQNLTIFCSTTIFCAHLIYFLRAWKI